MNTKDLLYYNGFGGFEKETLTYVIKTDEKTTPVPWSHMMANETFGTIVTSDGGGYTWCGNGRENKITSWANDIVTNKPSESVFIKLNNKRVSVMPRDNLQEYEVHFGFGFAEYLFTNELYESKLIIYVPRNRKEKIYSLKIKNKQEKVAKVSVMFCVEPVLGTDREYTKKYLKFKKIENGISIKNSYRELYCEDEVVVDSEDKCEKTVKGQKVFLKVQRSLLPDEEEIINFRIGIKENNEELNLDLEKDLADIKNFWDDELGKIRINTSLESLNIMMNGWLQYQTLVSRLWGRTSFYQAGGAFGFRDQLQDVLMFIHLNPERARKQILYHAMHQFKEGDVQHWWHPENNKGIRSRYTDDLLWLPYVTCKYVKITGDYEIFDEEIPYLDAEILRGNEKERYCDTKSTIEKENLFMHLIRAINKSMTFGENGLPSIGSGDWNDGMNAIEGQSVWLGFFMIDVLKKFLDVCESRCKEEQVIKYKNKIDELTKALNDVAWDGKWYKRAFFKDGTPLGSKENDECKIDGISQSWAVISGAGDREKVVQSMESLDKNLVDRENMIIKLLTPAFANAEPSPGYIKAYIEGVRENGGQYTHGAIWAMIASAILENKNRTYEYYKILNPIEHARTKDAVLKYKVEPYVIAADIYSAQGMVGRGGWTWYTGSSSWFYVATLEYLLGIKREGDRLFLKPCIPDEWESYLTEYKYCDAIYEINIYNTGGKNHIPKLYLDNVLCEDSYIKLKTDGKYKIDYVI